jgi:hypothetical protein
MMEHLGTSSMAAERWASWAHSVRGKKLLNFLFYEITQTPLIGLIFEIIMI